jgi:hypothetical protein
MAELLDPQTMDDIQRKEAQRRYVDAVQRGETGARLARSAGIQVPVGTSPPTFNPPQSVMPPRERWDSSANYVRYDPGDQEDSFWQNMQQRMGGLPIDKAQKAIQVAMQFQSERGFRSDIASGMDPAQAAMKWAPGLSRSTLSGIASLSRANRPDQAYEFTPGDTATGRPAAWVPKGGMGRPINISRSAITVPPLETGPVAREEVVPGSGVYIATQPGVKGFKIITAKTPGLTPDQRFQQESTIRKDLVKFQEQLQFMNPEDPTYASTQELIGALQNKLSEIKSESVVPPAIGQPLGASPQVSRPSTTPFKEGARIKSKKDGKFYIIKNGVPVPEE